MTMIMMMVVAMMVAVEGHAMLRPCTQIPQFSSGKTPRAAISCPLTRPCLRLQVMERHSVPGLPHVPCLQDEGGCRGVREQGP